MKIGKRSLTDFSRRLLDVNNYKSVAGFFSVYEKPVNAILAEVLSWGNYPCSVTIKTPSGQQTVDLFSAADFSTLNLIFCRQDYYIPKDTKTIIDIGSNIGLSSLYWLTYCPGSFVYCYEPSPVSFGRLNANLQPYSDRYLPHQKAVSNFAGVVALGIEESGVYSSLDLVAENSVDCECVHINEVLENVLKSRSTIDILKIDSEGHELRTIAAIDASFWKHIRCVNTDCKEASEYIPLDFKRSTISSAERFYRE